MLKTCSNCTKEYTTFDSKSKYCSRSCSAKSNNKKFPKRKKENIFHCETCGKECEYKRKYCSRKCNPFINNNPKICPTCKKIVKTKNKYCCDSCNPRKKNIHRKKCKLCENDKFENKHFCEKHYNERIKNAKTLICEDCSNEYLHLKSVFNSTLTKCGRCNVKKDYKIKTMQKVYDLIGKKCSICGYDECLAALEFHHINPLEKEYTIAQISNRNIEFIKTELEKCILVCGNCHRELHENDTGIYTVLTKQQMKAKENYELRKQFIMSYKVECKMCGYNKLKSALEFHHKNPEEKLFVISTGHFRNIESIKSEIEKCDVLCVNCHRNMHN